MTPPNERGKNSNNRRASKPKLKKAYTKVYGGEGKNKKLAGFQSFSALNKSNLFKES